jgi:cell division septation protein DedD
MKNSETGEYELVVGNGQLLSAFFIVVLLCGVAFGLGYMIGQNSQRSKAPETAANTAANTSVQTPFQPAASSAVPAQPPADQPPAQPDSSAQSEPAAPQPTTQPARETPAAPGPAPAPVPAPASGKLVPVAEAPAGSYWQLGAYTLAEVPQATVQMLKDGGMPVTTVLFPDKLAHILVGPYRDKRELSNAKEDLTSRFKIKAVYPRQLPIK